MAHHITQVYFCALFLDDPWNGGIPPELAHGVPVCWLVPHSLTRSLGHSVLRTFTIETVFVVLAVSAVLGAGLVWFGAADPSPPRGKLTNMAPPRGFGTHRLL